MANETPANNPTRPAYRDFLPRIIAAVVVIFAVVWLTSLHGWQQILALDPVWMWVGILVLLCACLLAIGRTGTNQWFGVLITPRYKMSLARLQIVLWTLLVFSAYMTIAIHRLSGNLAALDAKALEACKTKLGTETFTAEECGGGAINITFPPELLVAMGISAASFAGTSIIQSNKKSREVSIQSKDSVIDAAKIKVAEEQAKLQTAEQELRTARQNKEAKAAAVARGGSGKEAEALKTTAENMFNVAAMNYETAKAAVTTAETERDKALADKQKAETESEGLLHKNSKASEARFADIFKGDEIGNFQLIDMSKVQMFFLTLIVVGVYAAAVGTSLHDAGVMKNAMGFDFPPFSDTLNSLLAISHGTYLSVKTVDHTKTTS